MTFDRFVHYALNFYHQYPLLVVALAIVLLFVAYKKPKGSFRFVILLIILAAFFYAVGLFRDTVSIGTQNTHQMINKSEASDK